MGRPSFHEHEITHKSKKMKLFAALAAAAAAQQAGTPVLPMMPAMPAMPAMGGMNPLMLSMLLDDGTRDDDRTKLEKICTDAGEDCTAHFANIFNAIETTKPKDCTVDPATEADCTKAKEDAYDAIQKLKKSDMSDLLLLSMLGGQGMGDMNSMLPLLLMKDGGLGDNKMLMLMMMQGGNMGAMNPLLMMSLLE